MFQYFILFENCLERQSHICSLLIPSLSRMRMGLGPRTLFYQEIKSSHSLCWAFHLVWEYPSLFNLLSIPLSLLKACASYGSWPTHCCICPLRGGDRVLPLWHERSAQRSVALCQLPGETCWPWGTSLHYQNLSCLVSSLCK